MERFLAFPLPVFAAAWATQIEPLRVGEPGWVMAALTGVFIVLWLLNAIGKLPGGGEAAARKGNGFRQPQQVQLGEVHRIVCREDADKPGWPMVWASSRERRETRELLHELVGLKVVWVEDRANWHKEREVWKAERARLEERVTLLEERV